MEPTRFLGIDLGTSGCRGIVIDRAGEIIASHALPLPATDNPGEQEPQQWYGLLIELIDTLAEHHGLTQLAAIAIDGTSGTLHLADSTGAAVSPALMYHDPRAGEQAARIATIAPPESAAHGSGSALARWLWLRDHGFTGTPHTPSDWLTGKLCGNFNYCDSNNAMKLGYDPINRCWPEWLERLGVERARLPEVVPAGTPIGKLDSALARRWGVEGEVTLCAGTTDSTAAVIASGACRPGDAITSLGSTLVLKVVAERPIFAAEYGVYSQPFGDLWLVGGASNSGGNVLRHLFSDARMAELTPRLDPDTPTDLDYYPLVAPGERFPVSDLQWAPRLTPRPADEARFFQGLLEGIAAIEGDGYRLLEGLGAPTVRRVTTNGGGARNEAWRAIRQRLLGVTVEIAPHDEAAYGAARLASSGAIADPPG